MTSTTKTFHRYRLVRRIARGGMAEVFLALLRGPSGFEKRVALKKILPVYAGMEEFGILFRDEARLSALLEHSAIVQTYEFGTYEGEHFMAMEYVDGPDLEELLDRCRRRGILLPVEVVLHIVHELTRALEYSHSLQDSAGRPLAIIHRDVSPPNVLIGVHGEIKLTDFGVAKAADRQAETRPGVLRGKYAYMSPEQVRQGDIDHRSDIFSIGIVLYEALTGVNPFEGTTDFQTMEAVEKAEIEPAGFLRPDTPTEVDRILLACLESDPDLRYQSASDLRRDLAEVIRSMHSDGPDELVVFLKDVFPERAPDAAPPAADLGAPPWEAFAHRLAAMMVPMPVAVRKDVARPNRDGKLVIGTSDPGLETHNSAPAARIPEGPRAIGRDETHPEAQSPIRHTDEPEHAGTDKYITVPDELALGVAVEPGVEPLLEPAQGNYDEWVDEDHNPDRILTQPGVLMRAFGAATQLGPTYAPPPTDSLLPGPEYGEPVHGLDDVPDDLLGGVREHTEEGVPVFNEWDFQEPSAENPAHQVSLDLDEEPSLDKAPRASNPGKRPAPRRSVTAASGAAHRPQVTAASAPGPRVRLRPPGRPRLHPVSRPRIEQISPPVEPLQLMSSPGIVAPTAPEPKTPSRPQLRVVPDAPEGSEEPVAPPPPPPPRPLWATLVWAAVAVLVPLGSLSTINWLDEVQRAASTPKVVSPRTRAPAEPPVPQRRIEPLPTSRPSGQTAPQPPPAENPKSADEANK